MVAEILMMTEDFRNSLNRKIITFLSWLLPCNITTFFYQFPDCMIGTYGVLKLPVISNFLPSPTVTVLMTMVKEKLVSNHFANIFLWTLQFDEIFFANLIFFFTAGRFDEDGSFIGQYGTLQRRQQEQLLQQQMQQQELGIKQGGTYVWNTEFPNNKTFELWYHDEFFYIFVL